MEEQKEKKKFQKWPIVVLVLFIVLLIGSAFAWFTLNLTGTKTNIIKAGSLSMVLDDEVSDGILLQKAIPMSYQQGLTTTNYTFTLTNNGSKSDYTLSLKDEATYTNENDEQVTIDADKRIADTKIRYILLKDGEVAEASKSMLLSEVVDRVIDSGTIENGTTINYSLRIWIDSKAENEVMGQIFNARLQLDATQHQELATTVCKRATTLHTEICSQTDSYSYCSGAGYTESGSKGTSTITYGNLGTSGTLASGDAFDCDVNGDGTYDAETERFYYVTDANDTTAVLVYYNNVSAGQPNSSGLFAYNVDYSYDEYYGPTTAKAQLPTISQWSNVSLTAKTRDILDETGGIKLTGFSYDGYAARLITKQEIEQGCNTAVATYQTGELDSCNYLLENTKYSTNSNESEGTWIETVASYNTSSAWLINSSNRYLMDNIVLDDIEYGVRPTIEVLKSNISY